MPTPLLLLSDGVTAGTGLARIARDLAIRIHAHMPEFRVGTYGYGGDFSRALGFPQYQMEMRDWVCFNLPDVWHDFAGDDPGVIMTIWDASRMLWFAKPNDCPDIRLRKFLQSAPIEKWGYFPVDASGPHDKLVDILRVVMQGYDRVLGYSEWAEGIIRRTVGPALDVSQLPHGIDTSVFVPRNRIQARHGFGQRSGARNNRGKKAGQYISIPDDVFLIGIVATNQIRKDWALGIAAAAEIAKDRPVMLWIHIDVLEKHWSIPVLLLEYGFTEHAIVTQMDYTDEQMSWLYSACDVTLGIGIAEGFGFPIFESLACGTPCIHGHDGGAPEHMPAFMLVEPAAVRYDGPYCCRRGVYRPEDWAAAIRGIKGKWWDFPRHLDWNELWPRWEQWLKAGLK